MKKFTVVIVEYGITGQEVFSFNNIEDAKKVRGSIATAKVKRGEFTISLDAVVVDEDNNLIINREGEVHSTYQFSKYNVLNEKRAVDALIKDFAWTYERFNDKVSDGFGDVCKEQFKTYLLSNKMIGSEIFFDILWNAMGELQ